MKRKIALGLLLHTVVFLAAGWYLAGTIGAATDDAGQIIRLHQVEQLREHLLRRLEAVQSDLALADARHPATRGAAMRQVGAVDADIERCFGCHHAPEVGARLGTLRAQTARYRTALLGIDEGQAGPDGLPGRDTALLLGAELVGQVREMIDLATDHLEHRTLESLAATGRSRYVVFGLVVLGPLLSALVGLIALRGLTRPIGALVHATRRLKAGDLDHRVQGLEDEFAELSASFNEMAHRMEEQLRLAPRTEQLVVAGEMSAGLVHEIKNPLAGIKAAMQVLCREPRLAAPDRELLERVTREVIGLEGLLRSFLEYARPVKPSLAAVDVNRFVEGVTAFYLRSHPANPACPVRIAQRLGHLPPARVDPAQLKQILLNLLLNAVDAMPQGGAVEVRTTWDEGAGEVHIEVADGGRGISPAHAEQLFQPFFTTKASGTGLGLAVSKRLVEQQGGSICYLPNPGGGTIFRVRLRQAAPSEVATA